SYLWSTGSTTRTVFVSNAGSYSVSVTNDNGCTSVASDTTVVTVNRLTVVTKNPTSMETCPGVPVSFSITAIGSGTLSYQWYKGAVALNNGGSAAIAGVNTSTLTIGNPTAANAGVDYNVIVSSSTGCGRSFSANASLIVKGSFSINASAGANGTITPNGGVMVNCGGSQTFNITPAPGYAVQNVLVDNVSEGTITTRTFSNVTAPHTISATFIQVVNVPVYRINAGGPQVSTSKGTFAADNYFTPNNASSYTTSAPIAGTTDDAIYQSERIGLTNGTLSYAFPLPNGQYTVILHFAEVFFNAPNLRVFDVSMEGKRVLDDYDIWKKAGLNTATTETVPIIVTDGTLNINFSALDADGGINNPKVSAIEILTAAGNIAPVANAGPDKEITMPAASVMLEGSGSDQDGTVTGQTWTQVSGPNTAVFDNKMILKPTVGGLIEGIYIFSLVVSDNQSATSSPDQVTVTVNRTGTVSLYRINAGGPLVSTTLGIFDADDYYVTTNVAAYTSPAPIDGTTADAIYQSERIGTNGTLRYAFPVPNGQYSVTLHFAETFFNAPGLRVFDVSIEGNKVLDNYDIWKKAGKNTATTETFPVIVSDGMLNIYFSTLAADGGVDNPKVSAIDITGASGNISPVANAGADKSITLPTATVMLDGSGLDQDGMVTGYSWTQSSGPAPAVFNSKIIAKPTVSALAEGIYVFSLVVSDNQSAASSPDQVTVTVNRAGSSAVYRINAGGPQVATSIGIFNADNFYTPTSVGTSSAAAPIAGTTDDVIYQSDRFGTNGTLNYAFPVANGPYTVILHFAEVFFNAANARVFDVSLEGNKVLDNFDIWKKAGLNTATTETFPVMVSDGTLNIFFSSLAADGGVNNAKVSAIEILSGSLSPAQATGFESKLSSLNESGIRLRLSAKLGPNPSNSYSQLFISTPIDKPIQLRMYTANGQLVESRDNVFANRPVQLGAWYLPGRYYVEVTQAGEKVVLPFVKR
ncbi:MAG: malectin domain-containing carbohydrate-binding protein, partial [Chitinophagaceae bacterium]